MAQNVVLNGVSYSIPDPGDTAWGQDLSDYFVAVSTGFLQKAGGTFTLTAEVDFGATFGLKSLYFKSRTSTPATAGQVRLARADLIQWRNEANDGNNTLGVNASDALVFNGVAIQSAISVSDTARVSLSFAANALSADLVAGGVANSYLSNMAAATLKGNNTGGASAPLDLTATQVTAMLDAMVGDSGSGGTKGLVPAPSTGDAAKVLSGAGTWITAGAGTVTEVGLAAPAEFTVSGSPVSTTGTLTFAKANQNANLVYAGPSSGAAAAPTFRAFGVSDLPDSSSYDLLNCSLSASVGSSALTISLKDKDGNDPSASSPVKIAFRNATISSGTYVTRSASSAKSITISSGSTLGQTSSVAEPIYVYAVDDTSGFVLGVTTQPQFNESELVTSIAEGGAGGADSRTTLYTASAQTSRPARLLGVFISTQATAGTWASSPTKAAILPFPKPLKYALSSSSGNFTSASTTYVDVTNLSVSFTSSGTNPIKLELIPDGSASSAGIGLIAGNVASALVNFQVLRDATAVATFRCQLRDTGAATDDPVNIVAPPVLGVDFNPTPGTYTYKVQAKSASASCDVNVNFCKLLVYEMNG